ncbi:hypothetical protein MXC99_07035 [Thauera aromatica]|uniref:hypothetical protein n=1 Tax=Thauera aromatica TaxID=59405 RepID=UPI001FFCB8AE|nr:hypothetical protein [Thauera aromatica]MCK2087930.1 hypothetical protein [Thauera aromatica]
MNMNPAKNLTPARAFDAPGRFRPDFLIVPDQPAKAQTRKPIYTRANAANVANKGEDHQA